MLYSLVYIYIYAYTVVKLLNHFSHVYAQCILINQLNRFSTCSLIGDNVLKVCGIIILQYGVVFMFFIFDQPFNVSAMILLVL